MEQAAPRWPKVNVPPGYRFKPTPRELIQYYLEPWLATEPGQPSPGEFYGIMAAADVYGEDPGALTSRFQHIAHDDGNWYFLSVARWKDGKMNPRGKRRMSRAVGELGTWHGSSKKIRVRDRDRDAGSRQAFEFRPAGGGKVTWLMEEFTTVRNDAASGQDGLRVLCRLHLTPRAAAEAGLEENDDVPAPCSKRQRQRAAAPQAEHHLDANYWTAAPDDRLVSSSSYDTDTAAAAPAPPDIGCSYATTSFHAAGAAAAPVTELTAEAPATWQHQPMMEVEQAGDGGYLAYYCAGVHGGVYIRADDEPQRLETVAEDEDVVKFTAQDSNLELEDSEFACTLEHLLGLDDGCIMDSNSNAFEFSGLEPTRDGVEEENKNSDPKPEPSGGVQENDGGGDPKGDANAG